MAAIRTAAIPVTCPRKGVISGGTVNVTGRPFLVYYAQDTKIENGYWTGGQPVTLQHGNRLSLNDLQIESLSQSCVQFDGTSNSVISGGRYSTENAVGGKNEQIGFSNSSTNNYVNGVYLTGASDNGAQIKDNVGAGSKNKWSAFYNGTIISN